ncbi:MAG TPA: winged helix-turn-helix domain-containing protein [Pyrinomonadaceae bacterium]|nr:winged helix-turn-helix domain-containing protein [Pyrinomonadaceae bacterium]
MSKRESHLYEFGPYRLLPHERLLLRDGEPVALTPKAFETLVALVERCGRLVEKDELLNEVWAGTNVEESNIAQNVFALRRALGKSEEGGKYIETVPKRGYRFLASVTVVEDRGEELVVRHRDRINGIQGGGQQRVTQPEGVPRYTRLPTPVESPANRNGSGAHAVVTLLKPTCAETRQSMWRRKSRVIVLSGTLALAFAGLGFVVATVFFKPLPLSLPNPIKLSRLISGGKIWSAAVSPDGRQVAHVVENAGQHSISVRQVSTTIDRDIIGSEQNTVYWGLTFSPDGDYVYYLKHARGESSPTLYRVPAVGGTSRKIIAGIDSHITLSPDGKHIAFIRDAPAESILVIANVDGTNERRLAVRQKPTGFFSSGPRGGPSWSPDGQTIATGVISLEGGYHGKLIAVSLSDGRERPLTSRHWYRVAQVAWLSDGSGLLATARESAIAQIWHVSYPDGAVRKVTNDLNDYHGVSLTANSRTLVSVQFNRTSTVAFVPGKSLSASQRNTAGMNEGYYGVSWTPDGKLVYASEAAGNLDIWLMHQDGVSAEQLTTDSNHDSTPSVSPDGRSVVFVSDRNGNIPHIWRMEIDGSNQTQIANHTFEGSPSFTPDGRWVVYAAAGSGLWKVPAEGGQPTLIAAGNIHTPSVSPDGKLIACDYQEDQPNATTKIALVPIDGGPPVRIFDKPERLSSPTIRWKPDGRALLYVVTNNGVSNIWMLPFDGAPSRPITSFTSDQIFNFAWSRDNRQLAVARGTVAEHVVLGSDFR